MAEATKTFPLFSFIFMILELYIICLVYIGAWAYSSVLGNNFRDWRDDRLHEISGNRFLVLRTLSGKRSNPSVTAAIC